jgi:DNA-binding transcriptional ArsR family regulator/precorrin-6B methylase 2
MPTTFLPAVSALRAAAEPTRLRLLALLARAELTVGEICQVIGQSQPRVSRHLKLLCDAGLLDRFREQHWVYYRAPASGAERDTVQQLLALVRADDDLLRRDRKRMEAVIRERARRAADQLPAASRSAASSAVDSIILSELAAEPIGVLLDVGTGSGHLLGLLAANATRAVGIDISSNALRLARTNVHGAGLSHCELQRGDMYDLPFAGPLFDTVTVDRVLATAQRPSAALNEIARTLKDGGRAVVIEDFDALSSAGALNPIAKLREWFALAGLECQRVHPVDTENAHLLVALARRPAQTTAAA